MDLLDVIAMMQGTPVRRGITIRLTHDQVGRPTLVVTDVEAYSLSPDGSIDRVSLSQDRFYHCGCSTRVELGGQCGEPGCGRVSCINCFVRCAACRKPLCLEHTQWARDKRGREVPLCTTCVDAIEQRWHWSRITGGLVHPPALPSGR